MGIWLKEPGICVSLLHTGHINEPDRVDCMSNFKQYTTYIYMYDKTNCLLVFKPSYFLG